jgi:hypothetical protein
MESETNRINKIDDKPKTETPAPIVSQQQITQQQGVPVNIQQGYIQPNKVNISQQPYPANQPITYQPIYNQAVIVNPGQQNLIINQGAPIIYTPVEFRYRPVKMVCPYCNNPIKSNVEQRLNFCTCFTICLCALLIILALLSGNCNGDCGCISSRNNCCCCCCCCCYSHQKEDEESEPEPADECCTCFDDATHSCPVCKQILGESATC